MSYIFLFSFEYKLFKTSDRYISIVLFTDCDGISTLCISYIVSLSLSSYFAKKMYSSSLLRIYRCILTRIPRFFLLIEKCNRLSSIVPFNYICRPSFQKNGFYWAVCRSVTIYQFKTFCTRLCFKICTFE